MRTGVLLVWLILGVVARGAEDEVFDAAHVDAPPTSVRWVAPDYPDSLRADGVEGVAIVEYVVDTSGRVTEARCIGTNQAEFGQVTITALRRCRFRPGQIKGRPVNTRCRYQQAFSLAKGGPGRGRISIPKENRGSRALPRELAFMIYENSAPEFIGNRPVVYPFEALQAGKAGHAAVQFVIGTDARLHSLEIREASAPEFGLAALAYLEGARFSPGGDGDRRNYGPFVAEFDFKPNGRGDAEVSESARSLLKLMQNHPEEIITSGFDVAPKPLLTVAPVPPRTMQQDGRALIEVLIDKTGHAQLPRVVSCTAPELGAAAAQAAALWLFIPGQRQGRTVVTRAQIPFTFALLPRDVTMEPGKPPAAMGPHPPESQNPSPGAPPR